MFINSSCICYHNIYLNYLLYLYRERLNKINRDFRKIAIDVFHFKYVDWDCGIQPQDGSQGPTLLRFTASVVFSPTASRLVGGCHQDKMANVMQCTSQLDYKRHCSFSWVCFLSLSSPIPTTLESQVPCSPCRGPSSEERRPLPASNHA